jgi:subtilisin family serine protease
LTTSVPLPNAAQKEFLSRFKERSFPKIEVAPVTGVPDTSLYYGQWKKSGLIEQPIAAFNEVVIVLDPKLSPEQIQTKIAQYALRVLQAAPEVGILNVDVSELKRRLNLPEKPANVETGESSVSEVIRILEQDSSFVVVTRNGILTPFQTVGSMVASNRQDSAAIGSEVTDWGIRNAKIDWSWPLISSATFKIGVIDIGFAPHEDLNTVLGLQTPVPAHDHGNHTTGVLCAQHNGRGTRGVVPNCVAVITSGALVLDRTDPIERPGGGPQGLNTRFHVLLMDAIMSVQDLILSNRMVKEVNVSMGYNWMDRASINIVEPRYAPLREEVRKDGQCFLRVLGLAKTMDVAVVSAAGNDSDHTPSPVPAKLGSPINWAALAMRELDGAWSNAVVVEAHDDRGHRASFSNVGGDISAPGVNVMSALATNPTAYGTRDGTSVAAPHVTGALAIIRKLRPALSMREALSCLLSSPTRTDSGAPRLDLQHALAVQCPLARSSHAD